MKTRYQVKRHKKHVKAVKRIKRNQIGLTSKIKQILSNAEMDAQIALTDISGLDSNIKLNAKALINGIQG